MPAWQRLIRFTVLITACSGVFGAAILYADDAEVLGRFKTDKKYHALWVPVIVGSRERIFLVDTGTTISIFDKQLLSGQPAGQALVGSTNMDVYPLFRLPSIRIGQHDLRPDLLKDRQDQNLDNPFKNRWHDPRGFMIGIIGLDLSEFRKVTGVDIYGILGMDFLHRWVVQINFERGDFLISKKPLAVGKNAQRSKLYYDKEGSVMVAGLIPDSYDVSFMLDTGLFRWTGTLVAPVCNYLEKQEGLHMVETKPCLTLNGIEQRRLFKAESIAVGELKTPDVIFAESDCNSLGIDFLSRYLVTIDFPNRNLYLDMDKGSQQTENLLHSCLRKTNYSTSQRKQARLVRRRIHLRRA